MELYFSILRLSLCFIFHIHVAKCIQIQTPLKLRSIRRKFSFLFILWPCSLLTKSVPHDLVNVKGRNNGSFIVVQLFQLQYQVVSKRNKTKKGQIIQSISDSTFPTVASPEECKPFSSKQEEGILLNPCARHMSM